MIKNIILLTKISTAYFFQNFNMIDKQTKKINKKSSYFWMLSIVLIAVFFVSYEVLDTLKEYGQTNIFLNIYMTFMFIIMLFQTILIYTNVFYFSKDIETLMPYPIKPIELLFAKFNTVLSLLYGTELVFMFLPMIMYGLDAKMTFLYFISLVVVMFLLPIFITLIIGIINLALIHLIKLIKNKNVYQLFITTLLISIIAIGEYFYIKNMAMADKDLINTLISLNDISIYFNKSTIILNPLVDILQQKNIIVNILKLLILYSVLLVPFAYIGAKTYLKTLLKTTIYSKKNKNRKINLEKECKQKSLLKAYIENEWKYIKKNILFLIQYIFPITMLLVFGLVISIYIKINVLSKNVEIANFLNSLSLNIEGFCVILGLCQVLFSLPSLSLTAISRYGRSAYFIKYIPINLYKQFWLKNILQIGISTIIVCVVLFIVKFIAGQISIIYIIALFIDALLINILNSNIMLIIDLKRPILNWENEYEVLKQNSNKFFHYVYTIAIVLLLMYLISIFKTINFNIAIIGVTLIFAVLLLIVNKYAKIQIKKNKLFEKIS